MINDAEYYYNSLFNLIFNFNLLNFNYTDLNIQIVDKLTIKIHKKKLTKRSQDHYVK